MEEFICRNEVTLSGIAESDAVFSHESRSIRFYLVPFLIKRLSGTADKLNVILREELLPLLPPTGEPFRVEGELRSFNNRSGIGNRLQITVYALSLSPAEEGEWENRAELAGVICKPPVFRRTPMGRDITDLMLAVNRRYGRSDYLPCIVWGQNAAKASLWEVGDRVTLIGRIQSRDYVKITDTGSFQRTAFEVSVSDCALA